MTDKADLLAAASALTSWAAVTYPDSSLTQIDPADHRDGFQTVATVLAMIANQWMPLDSANATITALQSAIDGKYPIPTGSTAQYVRGDGTLGTLPSIPSVVRTVSTFSASIVTSTSGGGIQISTTKDSSVRAAIQIVTTASIGGNQSGTIVAEVAPTNSTTASDWVKYGEFTNGQALTLALTLQSVQTMAGQLCVDIPAGYWVRFRSINNSGTPTFAFQSGQKTIYG